MKRESYINTCNCPSIGNILLFLKKSSSSIDSSNLEHVATNKYKDAFTSLEASTSVAGISLVTINAEEGTFELEDEDDDEEEEDEEDDEEDEEVEDEEVDGMCGKTCSG